MSSWVCKVVIHATKNISSVWTVWLWRLASNKRHIEPKHKRKTALLTSQSSPLLGCVLFQSEFSTKQSFTPSIIKWINESALKEEDDISRSWTFYFQLAVKGIKGLEEFGEKDKLKSLWQLRRHRLLHITEITKVTIQTNHGPKGNVGKEFFQT